MTVTIDSESPAGARRAVHQPAATCAACRLTSCNHPDPVYKGIVPLRERK
ncbi:hypothetical protein [Alteriqipengyuania lutimaris]|nr:hypothetical protein [Alteriqipengyuania lutimaris]MBB3034020.1 hypothetical protein [Alteriqipengyuania lutimaris]